MSSRRSLRWTTPTRCHFNGFTIPALATRRMETNIELGEGQSFVIAGLIDNQVTETLAKIPGLSSFPILGTIFKSKSLTKSDTELVVMVTPEITMPLLPGEAKPVRAHAARISWFRPTPDPKIRAEVQVSSAGTYPTNAEDDPMTRRAPVLTAVSMVPDRKPGVIFERHRTNPRFPDPVGIRFLSVAAGSGGAPAPDPAGRHPAGSGHQSGSGLRSDPLHRARSISRRKSWGCMSATIPMRFCGRCAWEPASFCTRRSTLRPRTKPCPGFAACSTRARRTTPSPARS